MVRVMGRESRDGSGASGASVGHRDASGASRGPSAIARRAIGASRARHARFIARDRARFYRDRGPRGRAGVRPTTYARGNATLSAAPRASGGGSRRARRARGSGRGVGPRESPTLARVARNPRSHRAMGRGSSRIPTCAANNNTSKWTLGKRFSSPRPRRPTLP